MFGYTVLQNFCFYTTKERMRGAGSSDYKKLSSVNILYVSYTDITLSYMM